MSKNLSLRVSDSLHEFLSEQAKKDKRSLNNYIEVQLEKLKDAETPHQNGYKPHEVDPWADNDLGI